MTTHSINRNRLLDSIDIVRRIGQHDDGHGISRQAGSPAEKEVRRWLMGTCVERGIQTRQDGACNIICRIGPEGPAVVTGSHLDSVPRGGHLDGALGVLCGLEVLTTLLESKIVLTKAIELIAFFDEEGRFGSMIGSKAMAGVLDDAAIAHAQDETGRLLTEFLATEDRSAQSLLAARRSGDEVDAFIELHIEQGPVLDTKQLSIGVVENITGIIRWRAEFKGAANHAGTTPMHLRKDALQGVFLTVQQFAEIHQSHGGDASRYTVGRIDVEPNNVGVVPAVARFTLDLRDCSETRLQQLNALMLEAAEGVAKTLGLEFSVELHGHHEPTQCSGALVSVIERAASARRVQHTRMLSGALHDAATLSKIAPVGMIFVPSIGGVSHSSVEETHDADIETGANILLDSMIALAC